ncbi:MAG: Veg protein [Actinobacteria bacterium]|nr:MAG: Veg protein [Actinomycetota bacterium]
MSSFQQSEVVEKIKTDLESLVGVKLKLRANMGRCKIIEREGVLEETHPNLFVINVDEKRGRKRRISYSYADVLTKTVELSDPNNGDNYLPWLYS